LRQDVRYSYSRYRLDQNESLIPQAARIAGNQAIITFKDYANHFENVVVTFGAVEGIDFLAGQNITIIGTPHVSPNIYLLRGRALGIEINEQDYDRFPFKRCQIRRNEYEFYFMTYPHNPLLQEVQLDMIESQLLQAIGRARLVRYECCVTVLSNLPIPGADFVHLERKEHEALENVL
jgi:hypothetical protein